MSCGLSSRGFGSASQAMYFPDTNFFIHEDDPQGREVPEPGHFAVTSYKPD